MIIHNDQFIFKSGAFVEAVFLKYSCSSLNLVNILKETYEKPM